MKTLFEALQRSVTGKVVFIGLLILVLLIPIGMIRGLIFERMSLYDAARSQIANAWGESQIVGGPILAVPFQFTRMSYAQPVTVIDELYLLPEALEVAGDVQVQELKRGIYRVPVYTARLSITGRFAPPLIDGDYHDLKILWDQAQLALPLSDARSIKEPVRLSVGESAANFQPGGTRVAAFGHQLVAPYAELGLESFDTAQAFSLSLVLGGTGTLRFLPLGDVTSVNLSSNWASPSFGGAYLPEDRNVEDTGFSAQWRVLNLGRGYPSSWKKSNTPPQGIDASAFGVDLITPIGIHEASMRAAKYAVLFIGLSFVAYFLFELFAALRLHALQYLLIGMANCVFYLLLLALSEQIGFGWSYIVSATASTSLIGTYSAAVLGSARRALPVIGLLAAMYGYLYVTLKAEDYALLFGALGLFTVLAAFMFLTRRIDWHGVSFGANEKAPDNPAPLVQLHA
ncbi:MAG TPA: cell envelope integrity protein CreD [Gammaproteobacteria bacterium]|nr:cell envelope integrity protein CreD [Gammaproteobacteria bacterium]